MLARPVCIVLLLLACSPPPKPDERLVTVRVSPKRVTVGQEATVVATVTASDGSVGKGRVSIESDQGSLMNGIELELDSFGTASTTFICQTPCRTPIILTGRFGTVSGSSSLEFISQCDLGSVTSLAAPGSLNLFGTVLYFQDGAPIEAGNYRLRNTGGCLKYGSGQNWTVHAYLDGTIAWWVVGETTAPADRLFMPPGTYLFDSAGAMRGFATYAPCDAANRAMPPHDFAFAGGKLGIWLNDMIYEDNTTLGLGTNPSWSLRRITADCP